MAKVTLHATIFGEDGIKTRDYETALIPDAKNQEMQVINRYPDKTYQKIEGFAFVFFLQQEVEVITFRSLFQCIAGTGIGLAAT